jgi:cytochrome b involved in lipid metabolism
MIKLARGFIRTTTATRRQWRSTAFKASFSSSSSSLHRLVLESEGSDYHQRMAAMVAATAATAALLTGVYSTRDINTHAACDKSEEAGSPYEPSSPHWTPANVADDKFDDVVEHSENELEKYPLYTSEQVAENDGTDGKPTWMSYGGVVYDVTDFVANHPGGSEKIMMAAGSVSFVCVCLLVFFFACVSLFVCFL